MRSTGGKPWLRTTGSSHWRRWAGLALEMLLGTILIATWLLSYCGGLHGLPWRQDKGSEWERAYLVGLGVGCAFGVGVLLSIKNSLPLDTFGLSFSWRRVLDLRSGPLARGCQPAKERPSEQNGRSNRLERERTAQVRARRPCCPPLMALEGKAIASQTDRRPAPTRDVKSASR